MKDGQEGRRRGRKWKEGEGKNRIPKSRNLLVPMLLLHISKRASALPRLPKWKMANKQQLEVAI